jgi:hypothetical protein
VVEVYRGPHMYDYSNNPITLYWKSACQDDIVSTISLKPSYLKPCAKVEFHSSNVTFAITPARYVWHEVCCELDSVITVFSCLQ